MIVVVINLMIITDIETIIIPIWQQRLTHLHMELQLRWDISFEIQRLRSASDMETDEVQIQVQVGFTEEIMDLQLVQILEQNPKQLKKMLLMITSNQVFLLTNQKLVGLIK